MEDNRLAHMDLLVDLGSRYFLPFGHCHSKINFILLIKFSFGPKFPILDFLLAGWAFCLVSILGNLRSAIAS